VTIERLSQSALRNREVSVSIKEIQDNNQLILGEQARLASKLGELEIG